MPGSSLSPVILHQVDFGSLASANVRVSSDFLGETINKSTATQLTLKEAAGLGDKLHRKLSHVDQYFWVTFNANLSIGFESFISFNLVSINDKVILLLMLKLLLLVSRSPLKLALYPFSTALTI